MPRAAMRRCCRGAACCGTRAAVPAAVAATGARTARTAAAGALCPAAELLPALRALQAAREAIAGSPRLVDRWQGGGAGWVEMGGAMHWCLLRLSEAPGAAVSRHLPAQVAAMPQGPLRLCAAPQNKR